MRIHFTTGSIHDRSGSSKQRQAAFTLAEVVISILVTALVFGGILSGYIQSARRAEWTGMSLAAQAYGIRQLEQARAATWDISGVNHTNDLISLNLNNNLLNWTYSGGVGGIYRGYSWTNIDIPYSGTNYVYATNYVTLDTNINVAPVAGMKIPVQMLQVDTVWAIRKVLYTNRLANYYAPD